MDARHHTATVRGKWPDSELNIPNTDIWIYEWDFLNGYNQYSAVEHMLNRIVDDNEASSEDVGHIQQFLNQWWK